MPDTDLPLVVLVGAENSSPAVLYGLYDVLYSVGAVFLDMTVGAPGPESLRVKIASVNGQPFRAFGNILIEPHAALRDIARADAVVVCDMYSPIHQPPVGAYPEMAAWLRDMHAGGALITSVCSGTLVLAEAGLLDGHEAAAHWAYGELFAKHYPNVRLNKNSIICRASETHGIVTAGGMTAWHELALYLIARLRGARQASETAKVHLLAGHEDGQLPFAAMNRRANASDKVISDCQVWIARNYACANPVQHMARHCGLSLRTLSRRFQNATGRTPSEYVQALRVEEAKQELETGTRPIDDIGLAVGYEDPASFRRAFKRLAGVSPATYRRKFARIRALGA